MIEITDEMVEKACMAMPDHCGEYGCSMEHAVRAGLLAVLPDIELAVMEECAKAAARQNKFVI